MNKEDLKKQLETIKGLGNSPIAFECLLGTMASINYQFTECVAQLKRIAEQEGSERLSKLEVGLKVLFEAVDRLKYPEKYGEALPTPACCDGLRTAVRDTIARLGVWVDSPSKDEFETDYAKGTRDDLISALSAATCQRDESALADVVKDALRMSDLARKTKMEKGCVCSFCAEHHEQFTEALAHTCQRDESALADAVEKAIKKMRSFGRAKRITNDLHFYPYDEFGIDLQSVLDKYRGDA